jgi:hypothetical protein
MNETALAVTKPAFTDVESFEFAQRAAKLLSISNMVPKEYRGNLANCVIALNLAARMGVDPMQVMQNLYIVHGRPGWSSQFLISSFNCTGRFTSLRYEWRGEEGKDNWGCRAWAIEKATSERLNGTWITVSMAKKSGWWSKIDHNGNESSKWQQFPEQMLMYRAAAFFIRTYAPEIANGMHTAEEVADFTTVEVIQPPTIDDDGMIFDPETGEILKLDRPQSDTEAEFFEAEVVE